MRPATGHSLSSTSALACAFTHHLACNAIQGTFRFLLMPQPSPPRHKDPADDELGFWEKKKAVGAEGGQGETVPWGALGCVRGEQGEQRGGGESQHLRHFMLELSALYNPVPSPGAVSFGDREGSKARLVTPACPSCVVPRSFLLLIIISLAA